MFRKIRCLAVKGYMTLEAAFIMPWVIFIFVFLIYASFYLYGKCVLFQDAYTLCMRSGIQKEDEAVNYVNAHVSEQFGKKYFGTDKVQVNAGQHGEEVKIYAAYSVRMPFTHFMTMAKAGGWRIQTEASAAIINPTKVIRKCRIIRKIVEG